jgi:hypothetical protein
MSLSPQITEHQKPTTFDDETWGIGLGYAQPISRNRPVNGISSLHPFY